MMPPANWARHLEVCPVFGCWLWTGRLDRDGYGIGHRHRAMYELVVGPIDPGLLLDHRCRRRRCVNPQHLEPVTNAVNQLRASWRQRARVRKCPAGHELGTHGMVTPEGGRLCRICDR